MPRAGWTRPSAPRPHPASRGERQRPARGAAAAATPCRPGTRCPGSPSASTAKTPTGASLYAANESEISNPNLIYVGEELRLPRHLPAPAAVPAASPGGSSHHGVHPPARVVRPAASGTSQALHATTTNLSGTLSCSGLEALLGRGGRVSRRPRSPRRPSRWPSPAATSSPPGPSGERGYWQINPVNGALSTYDPYGNARAAVIMSADGTNWSPWTTYTSGAYAGRC